MTISYSDSSLNEAEPLNPETLMENLTIGPPRRNTLDAPNQAWGRETSGQFEVRSDVRLSNRS